MAIRAREVRRQIAWDHELESITGTGARAQVPRFLASRPLPTSSPILPGWKGLSSRRLLSELPPLRTPGWGRPRWARGSLAVSSGNSPDDRIPPDLEEQDGEPGSDDSRFQLDPY